MAHKWTLIDDIAVYYFYYYAGSGLKDYTTELISDKLGMGDDSFKMRIEKILNTLLLVLVYLIFQNKQSLWLI